MGSKITKQKCKKEKKKWGEPQVNHVTLQEYFLSFDLFFLMLLPPWKLMIWPEWIAESGLKTLSIPFRERYLRLAVLFEVYDARTCIK